MVPPFYELREKNKTDIIVKIEEHKALIVIVLKIKEHSTTILLSKYQIEMVGPVTCSRMVLFGLLYKEN